MNNKPTYLVLTPFFPSKDKFVGSFINDQLSELRSQINFNFEIIKLVSFFSNEKDYSYNKFNVRIFKVIDFPFFICPGFFNKLNVLRFKKFLIKRNISNIFFSHSHVIYPALYLVKDFKNVKFIQNHGLDVLQLLNCRFSIIRRLQRKWLIRKSIQHVNNADINIGVSKKVLSGFSQFKKYRPKNEYVFYNGVDRKKFYPKKTVKNKIFHVGCVANFWKIKDQITLIKAVQIMIHDKIQIRLTFVGNGPTLSYCKKYVHMNNLSHFIDFLPVMNHHKLNVFYNKIDLFVLPSYYEAFGCVLLEAWATDTSIILAKNQGFSEILTSDQKKYFLFDEGSHEDLSKKIKNRMNHLEFFEFNSNYDIVNTVKDFTFNCINKFHK